MSEYFHHLVYECLFEQGSDKHEFTFINNLVVWISGNYQGRNVTVFKDGDIFQNGSFFKCTSEGLWTLEVKKFDNSGREVRIPAFFDEYGNEIKTNYNIRVIELIDDKLKAPLSIGTYVLTKTGFKKEYEKL
jgi:hypothetical protein